MKCTSCQELVLLERIAVALEGLLQHVLDKVLPNPGPLILVVTGENGMLKFKIVLPALPPEPNDIVSGELTVTVDGASTVHPTTKDQTEVLDLEGNEDVAVTASFAYLDNKGNKSVHPSTLSEVLTDDVPPPNPGELGISVTGEF